MPILSPASDNEPLCQGDVLFDIVTGVGGEELLANPEGMVLVITRRCQAIRAEQVVVAPIVKKGLSGLAGDAGQLAKHLIRLRDGDGSPDLFYLGELKAGSSERYFAVFKALHTIQVPLGDGPREEFIRKHRRYRLKEDFVHDLHHRLFRAFASMGFDDEGWWSTADLELIVQRGKADIAKAQADVGDVESQLAVLSVGGEGRKKQLEKQRDDTNARLARELEQLAPFEAELERRRAVEPGSD